MSPDIEWHVGEDADQETIARTTSARRSPRRRWIVIGAIGLGVGLGLLYRSIPAPPPNPIGSAPTPTVIASPLPPRPTPESIAAATDRDAEFLASMAEGAGVAFNSAPARLPPAYADWYAALQNAYGRWGPPSFQTRYTVFETGTLPSGVAWVKLGQFRHGDFYRHTRFYRLEGDRWVWTLPDQTFWSGQRATVMTGDAGAIGPITIDHPIEEAPVISPVLDRFARAYQNLCESLKCPPPAAESSRWTPGLTLSITIQPLLTQPTVRDQRGTLSIDLPSPRVVGYYEDANALGDPYVSMAYATLIDPVVRLASGDYARWETERGGSLFLQAVATWKRARLLDDVFLLDVFYQPVSLPPTLAFTPNGRLFSRRERYVDQLRGETLVPLVALWDWPATGPAVGLLEHVAAAEAEAIVIYIEENWGETGVVRFLNALGEARSLDEAIETALPVSFDEFNPRWTKWITAD
jgi:hypothetical protein